MNLFVKTKNIHIFVLRFAAEQGDGWLKTESGFDRMKPDFRPDVKN